MSKDFEKDDDDLIPEKEIEHEGWCDCYLNQSANFLCKASGWEGRKREREKERKRERKEERERKWERNENRKWKDASLDATCYTVWEVTGFLPFVEKIGRKKEWERNRERDREREKWREKRVRNREREREQKENRGRKEGENWDDAGEREVFFLWRQAEGERPEVSLPPSLFLSFLSLFISPPHEIKNNCLTSHASNCLRRSKLESVCVFEFTKAKKVS